MRLVSGEIQPQQSQKSISLTRFKNIETFEIDRPKPIWKTIEKTMTKETNMPKKREIEKVSCHTAKSEREGTSKL